MNKITFWQFMDDEVLKEKPYIVQILLGSKVFRGLLLIEAFLFGQLIGFGWLTTRLWFAMAWLFIVAFFLDNLTVELKPGNE